MTIVIPVYNGANYLSEAIDSALAQTWSEIEILVVDDGSDDDGATAAVAARYGSRIRYIRKENGGVASALNRGIAEMRGDWLSWLSHDDLYDARKVEGQMLAAQHLGQPAVVFSNFAVFEQPGRPIYSSAIDGSSAVAHPLRAVYGGWIHGCTMLVPRVAFERCGIFDEGRPTTQDCELWFRILQEFPLLFVDDVLVHGRLHPEQGSRNSRHLDEASLLWLEMLDRTPAETMIEDAGSEEAFVRWIHAFLSSSPYRAGAAGLVARYPYLQSVTDPFAGHGRRRRAVSRLALSRAAPAILAGADALSRLPPLRRIVPSAVERLYGIAGHVSVDWYRDRYPASRPSHPSLDYLRRGWRNGRDPSPTFSTERYLELEPLSGRGGMNPLSHAVLTHRLATAQTAFVSAEGAGRHPSGRTVLAIHDGSPSAQRIVRTLERQFPHLADASDRSAADTSGLEAARRVLAIMGEASAVARAYDLAGALGVPLDIFALRPDARDISGQPPARLFVPNAAAALEMMASFRPTVIAAPDLAPVDQLCVWHRRIAPGETLRVGLFRGYDDRPLPAMVSEVAERAGRSGGAPIEFHVLGGPASVPRPIRHHRHPGTDRLTVLVCQLRLHLAWFPEHPSELHSFDLSDAMLNTLPVLAVRDGSFPERLTRRGHAEFHMPGAAANDILEQLERARRGMGFDAVGDPSVPPGARWRDVLAMAR